MHLSAADLMQYTEWEREKWLRIFRANPSALAVSLGPNRDARFNTVGDWVRHIFSAEARYVERLSGLPLTDVTGMPNDNPDELFEFGQQTRRTLKHFIETFPANEWDSTRELQIVTFVVKATPNKVIVHVLMHEIRHWAQIATLLRLNGIAIGPGDFIASPVMGGEMRRG